MKTIRIIKDLFNETPLTTEYIPSGLTNDNTLVHLHDKTVVLREPKIENAHLFNYPLENTILQHVKDLDTPLLHYNPETGVKVSTYIPDASTFKLEYLDRAARLIHSLHHREFTCGVRYDIVTAFKSYETPQPMYDLSPYHHFLDEAKAASGPYVLCHNDLVEGNFLFTQERDYLIDYEYACDNDIFFDLMSFITENDIQDTKHRNCFYKEYFKREPNPQEYEKLLLFERALHVLWCQWACMMYETHQKEVYREIAKLKYQRLMETL